jgi:hypothetical protein
MARKPKQGSGFKKFAITCSVLIAAQVVFLYVYGGGAPAELTPRDAVKAALDASGDVSDARKELLRVQLAIADYRSRNGQYPPSLSALVPDYFDVIPKDSETGQAMIYTVAGGRYRLGSGGKFPAGGAEPGGPTDLKFDPADLKIDPVLLASLEQDGSERASFVYDPTGKRDPFLPFDLTPKVANKGGTELENYAIGQLRYTSFLGSSGDPIGLVENAARKGFTVRKGTKIGTNGGVVVEILPSKIQILETMVDPITNEKKNTTVEMEIRSTKK